MGNILPVVVELTIGDNKIFPGSGVCVISRRGEVRCGKNAPYLRVRGPHYQARLSLSERGIHPWGQGWSLTSCKEKGLSESEMEEFKSVYQMADPPRGSMPLFWEPNKKGSHWLLDGFTGSPMRVNPVTGSSVGQIWGAASLAGLVGNLPHYSADPLDPETIEDIKELKGQGGPTFDLLAEIRRDGYYYPSPREDAPSLFGRRKGLYCALQPPLVGEPVKERTGTTRLTFNSVFGENPEADVTLSLIRQEREDVLKKSGKSPDFFKNESSIWT